MAFLLLVPCVAEAGGLKGKVAPGKEFKEYFDKEESDTGTAKVDFYWQVENGVLPIMPPTLQMDIALGVALFRKDGKVVPGFLPVHPEVSGAMLVPGIVVAPPQTTLKFHNTDPFVHELYSKELGKLFEPELQSSQQTRQVQFSNAGVYEVGCTMTPHLKGYVVVAQGVVAFKNPGKDGTFLFEDLAPGEYVVKVYYKGQVVATQEAVVEDSDKERDYADVELELEKPAPPKKAAAKKGKKKDKKKDAGEAKEEEAKDGKGKKGGQ